MWENIKKTYKEYNFSYFQFFQIDTVELAFETFSDQVLEHNDIEGEFNDIKKMGMVDRITILQYISKIEM